MRRKQARAIQRHMTALDELTVFCRSAGTNKAAYGRYERRAWFEIAGDVTKLRRKLETIKDQHHARTDGR